jgi:SAM-dependent methyltransferase
MGAMDHGSMYTDGRYGEANPTWHEEDAPFKSRYIWRLLKRNNIDFFSVAEIGCGTGAVLRNLRALSGRTDARWLGFDVASDIIGVAGRHPEAVGIKFSDTNPLGSTERFDVLLAIDVLEHVPDYMGFVASCCAQARYKIYHIPLDIHVSSALRDSFLNARRSVGHLHYFSERTARATLEDTGHRLIDSLLTPGAIELFRLHPNFSSAVANVPRFACGLMSDTLSARLFGGYSLLVLAE